MATDLAELTTLQRDCLLYTAKQWDTWFSYHALTGQKFLPNTLAQLVRKKLLDIRRDENGRSEYRISDLGREVVRG